MKTALIDYAHGEFSVTVLRDGKRLDLAWGTYPEVIHPAVLGGVARGQISLTEAAQEAAAEVCFGGSA